MTLNWRPETPAMQGWVVNQEQEENSCNHVQAWLWISLQQILLTECIMKGDKNEAVIPAAPATAIPRARTTVGNISNVIWIDADKAMAAKHLPTIAKATQVIVCSFLSVKVG